MEELHFVIFDTPINCGKQLSDKWEGGKKGVSIEGDATGVFMYHEPTHLHLFVPIHRVRQWETAAHAAARLQFETEAAAKKVQSLVTVKPTIHEVPASTGEDDVSAPRPERVDAKSLMADMGDLSPEEKASLKARIAGSKPKVR